VCKVHVVVSITVKEVFVTILKIITNHCKFIRATARRSVHKVNKIKVKIQQKITKSMYLKYFTGHINYSLKGAISNYRNKVTEITEVSLYAIV